MTNIPRATTATLHYAPYIQKIRARKYKNENIKQQQHRLPITASRCLYSHSLSRRLFSFRPAGQRVNKPFFPPLLYVYLAPSLVHINTPSSLITLLYTLILSSVYNIHKGVFLSPSLFITTSLACVMDQRRAKREEHRG